MEANMTTNKYFQADSSMQRPSVQCTWFIVTAVWTLAATASTLALILRKFTDWFFCLMAFSAWILATSVFPFWMAWRQHKNKAVQNKCTMGYFDDWLQ